MHNYFTDFTLFGYTLLLHVGALYLLIDTATLQSHYILKGEEIGQLLLLCKKLQVIILLSNNFLNKVYQCILRIVMHACNTILKNDMSILKGNCTDFTHQSVCVTTL